MFSRSLKPVFCVIAQNGAKNLSTTSQLNYKVTVCGAAGGIGQPLSLLLKQNEAIKHLALYDIAKVTPGVAVDLSHMDTPTKVTGHAGAESLPEAIKGADVVVIPAGVPRKPGMTRDDLFNTNASIVRDITECIAKCAPKAIIAIITNPVNSMVPIASEVMKKNGKYDPNRILGVTTLDIVRSRQFIGEINNVDPRTVKINVIGGHSGVTIIPLLSSAQPKPNLSDKAKIEALTKRIQEAGTEVVKAKAGGGSATLSMAWAASRITNSILRGLKGDCNIVECAYVFFQEECKPKYFAAPVEFGPNGIQKILDYGPLGCYERTLLPKCVAELEKNIKSGEEFITKKNNSNVC